MGRHKKSRQNNAQRALKMHQTLKARRMLDNPTTSAENRDEYQTQIETTLESLENPSILVEGQHVIKINDCNDGLVATNEQSTLEMDAIDEENDNNMPFQVEKNTESQEKSSNPIKGRRIIDINKFFSQLKIISEHGPMDCGIKSIDIVGEVKVGLHSLFRLKCRMCNKKFNVESESPSQININTCAVAGTIAIGCGHSQLQEFSAALDLPLMTENTYKKHHYKLSNQWEKISFESMNEAAQQEREMALAEGRVDKNGVPIIDVIVDGCWSKRTYKKNYSALSGAATIIGKRTGKVLFLGVKNKYCSICAQAEKKNQDPKEHTCYKNYNGSSTAMESEILVEGFKCSIEMHNLIYGRMVSDGDASTYSKLLKSRPYPHVTIEKIECRNHLLRNLCNRFAALQTDTKYLLRYRKLITQKRIMILRGTIRKIIKNHQSDSESLLRSNIELLYNDLLLAHLHTFDDHSRCKPSFCNVDKDKTREIQTPENGFFTNSIWSRICGLMSNLASHAPSLIHDVDSNIVENLNSIVAKLVGGKRINFSKRGSYQMRCHAAVVAFNTQKVISSVYKGVTGRSPRGSVAKLEKKRIMKIARTRKINRKKNRQLFSKGQDVHYGSECEKPDMPTEIFEKQKETFLLDLVKTKEQREIIEKETVLQSKCSEWLELRRNILTASNYGKVVKRRHDISCQNLVKEILYKDSIAHVKSIKHGTENEKKAIRQLETQENVKIEPCGLFIDETYNYLGATPDGMIAADTIVEIKCPITAFEQDIIEVVKNKKLPIYKLNARNELTLNKKHSWYFQIQGQLHVANKKKCLFAIWCGDSKKLQVEWIERDDNFWREMEPKLIQFYMECLLPELVDPRYTRNMQIRDPLYIQQAMKEKQKKGLKRKNSTGNENKEESKKQGTSSKAVEAAIEEKNVKRMRFMHPENNKENDDKNEVQEQNASEGISIEPIEGRKTFANAVEHNIIQVLKEHNNNTYTIERDINFTNF